MPVAAFVALFVAAVQCLAAVMAALVFFTVMAMMPAAVPLAMMMVTAVMAFAVVAVVVACRVGIIFQRTLRQRLRRNTRFLRSTVDWTALIMTVVLAAVCFGSWKISKKGISPIGLIGISAVAGIAVYGIKG